MKKFVFAVLVVALAFSLTCTALAASPTEIVLSNACEVTPMSVNDVSSGVVEVTSLTCENLAVVVEGALPIESISLPVMEAEKIYELTLVNIPNEITPFADLTLPFSNLGYLQAVASPEIYAVTNNNATITIKSATWNQPTQDIRVGWYNVDTAVFYYAIISGGSISNAIITPNNMPDGNYRVCIQNAGSNPITGAILYQAT